MFQCNLCKKGFCKSCVVVDDHFESNNNDSVKDKNNETNKSDEANIKLSSSGSSHNNSASTSPTGASPPSLSGFTHSSSESNLIHEKKGMLCRECFYCRGARRDHANFNPEGYTTPKPKKSHRRNKSNKKNVVKK